MANRLSPFTEVPRRVVGLRLLAFLILLALPLRQAAAVSPDLMISQLTHRSWSSFQLAPDSITSIAQSSDGWMWLSTGAGPIRFNGLEFDQISWTYDQIPMLSSASVIAADDALWVGYSHGGVVRFHGNSVTPFEPGKGLPDGKVHALARDGNAGIWAATETGVARYINARWEKFDSWPDVRDGVFAVFVARDNTLWLATATSVVAVTPDRGSARRVLKLPPIRSTKFFAQSLDGGIWLSAPGYGVARVDEGRKADQHWFSDLAIGQLLVDRDGNLWMTGDALRRLRWSEKGFDFTAREALRRLESFTRGDGLTGPLVSAIFEDNVGSIWAATNRGLDRFSATAILALALPAGVPNWGSIIMVEDGKDGIWLAAGGAPALLHYTHGRLMGQIAAPLMTAGCRDINGTVWFGGPHGVGSIVDGQFSLVAPPVGASGEDVLAMVHDKLGGLWVSIKHRGTYRLANGLWTENGGLQSLPPSPALVATRSESGDLWFGYERGVLARVRNGNVTLFGRPEGLRIGAITALTATGDSLWLGGESGLMRFNGEAFQEIHALTCAPFRSIWGIRESIAGDLWVHRATGLALVEDIRRAPGAAAATLNVPCRGFGPADGLGAPQLSPGASSLALSRDGNLWLTGKGGPKWASAENLKNGFALGDRDARGRPVSAVPVINSLSWTSRRTLGSAATSGTYISGRLVANNQDIKPPNVGEKLTLPPHIAELSIQISTSGPAGILYFRRYQWRLLGLSDSWEYASSDQSRMVKYFNLSPGMYRFEVVVDVDGVNSPAPTTLAFEIEPAFYQTVWFRACCVVAALALLALLFRLQLQRAGKRMGERFEAQVLERERIARDLHDTLLQGVQGLIMKVHSASEQMPEPSPARTTLHRALDDAQSVLIESRDRVMGLRSTRKGDLDLAADIAGIGSAIAKDAVTNFTMEVHGEPRSLQPQVHEESLAIVREAILNAIRHADARHIVVDIFHSRSALRVVVSDDGKGIPQEVRMRGRRVGHWGLPGMRERATRIRGTLHLDERQPSGTVVVLHIRAAAAYQQALPNLWRRTLARFRSARASEKLTR